MKKAVIILALLLCMSACSWNQVGHFLVDVFVTEPESEEKED